MAINRLTDREVKQKPGTKEIQLADGGGLHLRIRPSGEKFWLFIYTFAGKRYKLGIGALSEVSLATARGEAVKAREQVAQGIDPQLQRKRREEEEAAKRARLTVQELFDKWQRLELSARKDKGAEIKRSFGKDVLPIIGGMAAEGVKRQNIASLLDKVVERGARIVARNMLGDLRQMFGFAIARGLLENDPTSHMKRDDWGKKVERARVLSETEVKALQEHLPGARMAKTSELAIWIILATCCRVGELSRAEWRHIDLESGTWRIPPENAKNAKEHTIHLSTFALEQFKALHALTSTIEDEQGNEIPSTYALPARFTDTHVCVKSLAKQIGDRQRGERAPMKCRTPLTNALELTGGKWTPHDLRRTGATLMVALGVPPEVVERCLNHVEANRMKRIYQRHEYSAEMKAAWSKLGDRLDLLTRGDVGNVIAISSKRA